MAKKQQGVTVTPRMRRIYSLRKNAKINASISAGLARMEAKAAEQLWDAAMQPVMVIDTDTRHYSPLVVMHVPSTDPEMWGEENVLQNIKHWSYVIVDRRHVAGRYASDWLKVYWYGLKWFDSLDAARAAYPIHCKHHAEDAIIDGDDDWYPRPDRDAIRADEWHDERWERLADL